MNSFSNEILDLNELPDYREVELTPIAPKYKKIVIFNLVVFSISLIAITLTASFFLFKEVVLLTKALFFLVVLLFLIGLNVFTLIAFKRKSYAFREQDVIYRSGILTISHEIVPYNRLQHVVLKQGWLSRSLGLASIHCYTAASSVNEIAIPGLEKNDAERIKDMLINRINNIELSEQIEIESVSIEQNLDEIDTNQHDLKDE